MFISRTSAPRVDVVEQAAAAFDTFVAVISTGQQAGVIMAGNPADFAAQTWSAVHGAVSLELAGCTRANCDPDDIHERVLDMIVASLAP